MTEKNEERPALELPPGLSEERLTEAVVNSGYPLQTVAALELDEWFTVLEEWGFLDRTTGEHRSLDLFAWCRLDSKEQIHPQLVLLIECKRSDLPFVFFASALQRVPQGFPALSGFGGERFQVVAQSSTREVKGAEFFSVSDLPFVGKGPTQASSFTKVTTSGKRVDLTGDYPYKQVLLPLASAQDHFVQIRKGSGSTRDFVFPGIVLCLAIMDAPMIVARGTPDDPLLENEEWVRIVRQEAARGDRGWDAPRYYVVDAVHRRFLHSYVEDHLLPFSNQLAARMTEKPGLTKSMKARAPSHTSWSWSDLESG